MNSILWVSIAWVCFYAIHSLLALNTVKQIGRNYLGSDQAYRLFYVIFSIVSLAGVLYLLMKSESVLLFSRTELITYASLMSATLGIIILQKSFKKVSTRSFLGIRKEETQQLVTSGIHQYIRHPIYTGTILIYIGAFLFIPTNIMLITMVWLVLYLPVGIYLEEKKLVDEFGDAYRTYRHETKTLIPWIL